MCGQSKIAAPESAEAKRQTADSRYERANKARTFYLAAADAQRAANESGPVRAAINEAIPSGVEIPAHVALFAAVEDTYFKALTAVGDAQRQLISTTVRRWGEFDRQSDRTFPSTDTMVLVSSLARLETVQADYKAALAEFETAERESLKAIMAQFGQVEGPTQ